VGGRDRDHAGVGSQNCRISDPMLSITFWLVSSTGKRRRTKREKRVGENSGYQESPKNGRADEDSLVKRSGATLDETQEEKEGSTVRISSKRIDKGKDNRGQGGRNFKNATAVSKTRFPKEG